MPPKDIELRHGIFFCDNNKTEFFGSIKDIKYSDLTKQVSDEMYKKIEKDIKTTFEKGFEIKFESKLTYDQIKDILGISPTIIMVNPSVLEELAEKLPEFVYLIPCIGVEKNKAVVINDLEHQKILFKIKNKVRGKKRSFGCE